MGEKCKIIIILGLIGFILEINLLEQHLSAGRKPGVCTWELWAAARAGFLPSVLHSSFPRSAAVGVAFSCFCEKKGKLSSSFFFMLFIYLFMLDKESKGILVKWLWIEGFGGDGKWQPRRNETYHYLLLWWCYGWERENVK